MAFQATFTQSYAAELLRMVKNHEKLERYAQPQFEYNKNEVRLIPELEKPLNLAEKLIPSKEGECASAIALYEAYPKMTPLMAADSSLWIYLSHADLFQYVQTRYNDVLKPGFQNKNFILNHWFTFDNWQVLYTVGALWWIVFLTIDNTPGKDKYKYTRRTFINTEYRTNFLKYTIGRHKEAVFGYYDFLEDNPQITDSKFQDRNRFITKYLNRIGGVKLLSALPREVFYEELSKIKDKILAI